MQFPTHTPVDALAQVHPGPHGPHPGPHWGGGPMGGASMGAVGGFGGWLTLLLVVLLLVGFVAALAYAWLRIVDDADDAGGGAMRTLRERYAAGELDDEEFDRRRHRLLDGD